MKRLLVFSTLLLLTAGLTVSFTNCSGFSLGGLTAAKEAATGVRSSSLAAGGVELLSDANFSTGFRTKTACGNLSCGNLYEVKNPYNPGSGRSPWFALQLGSLNSLNATGAPAGDNYVFGDDSSPENQKKVFRFFGDGRIEMAINGLGESGGQYLTWNEARKWPHFVIEQNISAPGGGAENSGSLDTMAQLVFDMNIRILSHDQNRRPGYDPALRAGQFLVYFTVQNLRGSAADNPNYGKYIWLGIPVFDDRNPSVGANLFNDSGPENTGAAIYTMPYSAFSAVSTHSGQLINLHADILGFAKDAVAQAGGRIGSTNLSDYKIGMMNLGYEVTGLNDIRLQFSGLSLKASYTNSVVTEPVPVPQAPVVEASVQTIPTGREALVIALYQKLLARAPEAGAIEHWAQQSCASIGRGISNSPEATSHFSSDQRAFVTSLYAGLLGRAPDSTGLDTWLTRLNNGSMDRAAVIGAIVDSTEFKQRCQ